MSTPLNTRRCDIFCRVIDNHGDIGVCWRLARQLQAEHGWQLRLWVDDIAALAPLLADAQDTHGIDVRAWSELTRPSPPEGDGLGRGGIADIVIEAFACELPESYVAAMAARPKTPVWINLEYLCVEDWGAGVHLQPSPHPRLPLTKHFFVPGILPGTGGLLCERDLLSRQQSCVRAPSAALQIFLFCYDNPALPLLLDVWASNATPIHCRVAAGKPAAQVARWLGQDFAPGASAQRGALQLTALPFVAQTEFDALLWESELNFVRGEDSFARAQWAALPFVWQIYVQEDNAHLAKLGDFLDHYRAGLPAGAASAATALADFSRSWNAASAPTPETLRQQWTALQAALPNLRQHAAKWREHLILLRNLAENLALFCQSR